MHSQRMTNPTRPLKASLTSRNRRGSPSSREARLPSASRRQPLMIAVTFLQDVEFGVHITRSIERRLRLWN
jgi:hypothetical protein